MKFSYEVLLVNPDNRVMEVRYTADGYPPVNVSMRLPYIDESLESVVQMFSPVNYWKSLVAEVQHVFPGTTGQIEELEPMDVVPSEISRFQARQILRQYGLFESVELLMNDPDLDPLIKEAWEQAGSFFRHSPLIMSMAESLSLTSDQLDQMFKEASQVFV